MRFSYLLFLFTLSGKAQYSEPVPEKDVLMGYGRQIFLNGVNISGSREQVLKDVTLYIDAQGHMRITAPQYSVKNTESYHPLLPRELPKYEKSTDFAKLKKELETLKKSQSKEKGISQKPKPILEKDFNVEKLP